MKRKSLNEHLFDALDRLSEATDENIELESKKALHVISVSEQILQVARLKIEILSTNSDVENDFKELDSTNDIHEIENNDPELVRYGSRLVSKETLGNHSNNVIRD